jgi:N-acetylglucosaminyldiphosphoundecaprenol N-acetyl-beta-D-mannosaminyltransferase
MPIDKGHHSVLGVRVNAVDYATTLDRIIAAAHNRQPLTVTALAVHGVMTGALDPVHRVRLNTLDLVVPDGQPVRWALALLHGASLPDRVYGPTLTLKLCELAADQGLSIYLYGTTPDVLAAMTTNLREQFPSLQIAGTHASAFRQLTADEQRATAAHIAAANPDLVLCGLGAPRQETWVYEHRDLLNIPTLAVGAAFDFIAGTKSQAPRWMQDNGLEWLYRLLQEPGRLWRRYLLLNPAYITLFLLQWTRLWRPKEATDTPPPLRHG